MKKSKIIILFLLIIGVFIFNTPFVVAKENFEIKNISVSEKSSNITVDDLVFENNTINSSISFNQVNDFVTFDIEIDNNTNTNYVLDSIKNNINTDFLKIESENIGKIYKNNSSDIIKVKIIYNRELQNHADISLSDVSLSLVFRDPNVLINPLTSRNIIFFVIALIVISISSLFAFKNKKSKLLLLLLILIPTFVYAEESINVSVGFNDISIKGRYLQYSVQIDDGEGNITENEITYGSPIGELPIINPKTGYDNYIWENQYNDPITGDTIVTEDLIITPIFSPILYSITYDLNGGELEENNPDTYTIEDEITLHNPKKEGYSFAGWSSDNGETYQTEVVINKGTTGDLTFVAHYSANSDTKYTVIHNKMDLNGNYVEAEREQLRGATDTNVTPQTKSYVGFTTPPLETKNIDGDGKTTFVYNYSRNRYQFNIEDRTYVSSDSTINGEYYYETPITIKATNRAGYSFKWSDGNTDLERSFVLNSNLDINPIYTPYTNTIYRVIHKLMNMDGTTYTTRDDNTYTGTTDTSVTPDTNTYEGFTKPNTQTVNIDGDGSRVVEYLYTRNKYNLTLENSEYIETNITSGEYYYGTEITLTAKDMDDHDFIKWSNDSTNRTITITLRSDLVIGPIYSEHGKTITFDYNGYNGDELTRIVEADNMIGELPNPVREGYFLDGWYDNLLSGHKISSDFIPTSDMTLYAKWIVSVDSLILDPTSYILGINQEKNINISNADSIEENYSFVSQDISIVTVSDDGVLKGKAPGNTTVTITGLKSGQTKTVDVIVSDDICRITFDSNGGTSVDSVDVFCDYMIGSLPTSEKDTFYLEGWYSDASLNNKIDETFIPHDDVTLYARWAYDVIYDANGGAFGDSLTEKTITYYENSKISRTQNVNSDGEASTTYANNLLVTDVVTIPKAERVKIEVWYSTESLSYDWLAIYPPNIAPTKSNYSKASISNGRLGNKFSSSSNTARPTDSSSFHKVFYYDGDTIKLFFTSDNSVGNYGYYAIISDANIDTFEEVPVKGNKTSLGWYTNSSCSDGQEFSLFNRSSSSIRVYAKYITYNVITFNTNGGGTSFTRNVDIGTSIGELSTPTRSNYQFDGWYNDQTGERIDSSYVPLDDITITAHWSPIYTITLNPNGGSVSPTRVNAVDGIVEGDLPIPSRDNYQFDGWYTDMSAGDLVDANYSFTANTTIYARWLPIYNVSFLVNEYSIDDPSRRVVFGNEIGELPTPTRNGYRFDGWYLDNQFTTEVDTSYVPTANTILYPKWTYQVSYDSTEGKFSDDTTEKDVTYTEKYVISHSSNVDDLGYAASKCSDNTENKNVTIPGAKRLKIEIWYSTMSSYSWLGIYPGDVTPSGNNSSSATISNGMLSGGNFVSKPTDDSDYHKVFYYDGDSINIYHYSPYSYVEYYGYYAIISADSGDVSFENPSVEDKLFTGWYYDSQYTNLYDSSSRVESNIKLYAKYSYYNTVTFDPNGGNVLETSRIVYRNDPIGSLPIPTKTKYYFLGWCTDPELNNMIDENYVPDENITLYAKWIKSILFANLNKLSIKIQPEEEATIIVTNPDSFEESFTFEIENPDIAVIDENGKVTAISEGTTNVILRGDISNYTISVKIVVEYIRFAVTFDANGGDIATVNRMVIIDRAIGELPTPVREWYTFDGWYTGITNGFKVDENYIISHDTFLFARWFEIPSYNITFEEEGGSNVSDLRIEVGSCIGSLDSPQKDNYFFDGWYTEPNGNGTKVEVDTIPDGDLVLYANWIEPQEFTILFDPNGGDVSYNSKKSYNNVVLGDLPVPTRSGYTFAGWLDVSDNVYYDANSFLTKNVTVKAQWASSNAVARIKNTYYEYLGFAYNAAKTNDEIVLLKSITSDFTNYSKTITLNLNSHSLKGLINNQSNLTILSGTLQNSYQTVINNSGTLVLGSSDSRKNDGIYISSGINNTYGDITLIKSTGESNSLYINNSTIQLSGSSGWMGTVIETDGNLYINNSTINANGPSSSPDKELSMTAIKNSSGNTTINSSTIKASGVYTKCIDSDRRKALQISINNSSITCAAYERSDCLSADTINLNNSVVNSSAVATYAESYSLFGNIININGGSIKSSTKCNAINVIGDYVSINDATLESTFSSGSSYTGSADIVNVSAWNYLFINNSNLEAYMPRKSCLASTVRAPDATCIIKKSTLVARSSDSSVGISGKYVDIDDSSISSTATSTTEYTLGYAVKAHSTSINNSTISNAANGTAISFEDYANVNDTNINVNAKSSYDDGYGIASGNSSASLYTNNVNIDINTKNDGYGIGVGNIDINNTIISVKAQSSFFSAAAINDCSNCKVNGGHYYVSGGDGQTYGLKTATNAENVFINNATFDVLASKTGETFGILSNSNVSLNNSNISSTAVYGSAYGISSSSESTLNINDSSITTNLNSYKSDTNPSPYGISARNSNLIINNSFVKSAASSSSVDYCYGISARNIEFNDSYVDVNCKKAALGITDQTSLLFNGGFVKLTYPNNAYGYGGTIRPYTVPQGRTLTTTTYSGSDYIYLDGGEHQVTLNFNGVTPITITNFTKNSGEKLGYLPSPTNPGYYFDGWYTSLEGGNKVDSDFIIDGDIELFARWKKSIESATFESSAIEIGLNGEKMIVITNADEIEETYSFSTSSSYFSVDQTGKITAKSEGEGTVTITGDISKSKKNVNVYVSYEKVVVRFNSNGGSPVDEKRIVKTSNIGSLSTPTKRLNRFVGWFTGIDSGIQVDSSYVPTTNEVLYARWEELDNYRITLDTGDGDPLDDLLVNKDDVIDYLPTPHYYGHVFSGWFTDETYSIPVNLQTVANSNMTIYAKWEEPHPVSFETDSWATIIATIESGQGSIYPIGSTKQINVTKFGTYNLMISNNSNPEECSDNQFSQTACGYVFEFSNIVSKKIIGYRTLSSSPLVGENTKGGWESSYLRNYLNNVFFEYLPEEFKNAIITTKVVSGYNSKYDSSNIVSNDKLYLLSLHEVLEDIDGNPATGYNIYDTSYDYT